MKESVLCFLLANLFTMSREEIHQFLNPLDPLIPWFKQNADPQSRPLKVLLLAPLWDDEILPPSPCNPSSTLSIIQHPYNPYSEHKNSDQNVNSSSKADLTSWA